MAIMSPLFRTDGLNMKESRVAAEVNFMSKGTPSLACMTSVHLYVPFLLAGLGMTSHTLEQKVGEQGNGSGIYNLKTFHPDCISVFVAVRGKYISVYGV